MEFSARTLGEVCDEVGGTIRTGPFGSQLHESDYAADGLPVVMPKDIVEGRVSAADIARIGPDDEARLRQHKLQYGDIVYGRRGDIGRRALIHGREKGWLCGTGCLRISLGDTVLNPAFLYYYLGQPEVTAWIYNQAIGSTLPNLNTSIIRSVRILYPSRSVQRKVAAVLSSYDDLIENNTRRIQILKEMARALYREWFVDLRFPGYQEAHLVDSPVGPIPESWRVERFGQVVQLAYGRALKTADRIPGPFPVFGSSGIVGFHSESLVDGPGIVVGRKGNVGSVFWTEQAFFPIDTVFYVRSNLSLRYVFYNFQGQQFLNNDAAVPGLSRHQAYSLPFLVPDADVLHRFDSFADNIFRQRDTLERKNANLRATRDLLLPRLVSGELNVSDLDIAGT